MKIRRLSFPQFAWLFFLAVAFATVAVGLLSFVCSQVGAEDVPPYEGSHYLRVVEEVQKGKANQAQTYIVVDEATGVNYFASMGKYGWQVGSPVYDGEGKVVVTKMVK